MAEYSVLMSVYAKENPEYLRESIESIWNQTFKTDDFWVVCDGPLTKELDVVLEENQKAHKEVFHLLRLKENVGLGRALNEGLKCGTIVLLGAVISILLSAPIGAILIDTSYKKLLDKN